jgi:hypothetical protein
MVSKCANPTCTARMKYLHEGRIFIVQSPSSAQYWRRDSGSFSAPPGNQIEYFWLCNSCAEQMKITPAGCLEYVHNTQNGNFTELTEELVA